jgi:TRAP-type C4-dicarboxylate transport system substrate-binding protein
MASRGVWDKLTEEYGRKLLKEAMDCYKSTTDYLNDPNADKQEEELYKAIAAIDHAIGKQHDLSYTIKVARYDLHKTFESLVDEIYPEK